MEDLRPCPFCGASGIFWDRGGMECPACAARGPANEKQRVCVSAWNTRPAEDALTAQLRRFVTLVAQPDASLPPYLDDDEVYRAPVSVGDVRAARTWLMDHAPDAPVEG